MADFPQPDITDTNRPFWEGLDQGRLLFQECDRGHRWLPARDFCPECLSSSFQFVEASGRATVLSWVVYRTAFNDAFKDRLPYNVSLVQLAEGPRMMTNVLCDPDVLAADLPVDLVIQKEDTCSVARFQPASREAGPR
jgi:uncharacterized OB-fold protein